MPKVTIDSVRGINQTSGTGFEVTGAPITRTVHTCTTGQTSANTFSVVQIAGTGNPTVTLADGAFVGQIKTVVITADGNVTLKDSGTATISGGAITATKDDCFVLVYGEGAKKWTLLT